MKDTPEKEAYILVYNNDFNEAYDNHLTAMDLSQIFVNR